MREQLAAAGGLVQRDLRLMLSYRMRFVTQVLGSFFSLTLFYYISRLVNVKQFETADSYYAFAVVGLIILQVLNSTLSTPPAGLRQELVAGTYERLVLSPFGAVGGSLAMLLFPFVYALAQGLVMLGFAATVFGVHVQWETAALVLPLGALGALSFAPFGVLLLALVLLVKQALSGTTFIVAGISLIAGLYFPVSLLPGWIRWASDVQPFTPAVDLLRNVLVGTPLSGSAWADLGKVAAFPLVLLPVSVACMRAALVAARRRGTIIEY